MKSLQQLLVTLLDDLHGVRDGGTDLSRDKRTITERIEHEGDSFVTITLPAFCTDFERGLHEGRLDPRSFLGFSKVGPCIPSFLRGYMLNVFDKTGNLRTKPDVRSISAIRQICLFAKKVERPCSPERESRAIQAYLDCEAAIKDPADEYLPLSLYGRVADIVLSSFLDNSLLDELEPRHGSGAVVEGHTNNAKWANMDWTDRLESVLPYSEVVPGSMESTSYGPVAWFTSLQEPPCKVVLVPKTLKTPRVIAIEPAHNQFVQQGIMRWIVPRIEGRGITAGRVNFREQKVNQDRAREGSVSGKYATLDLSEASDRVSYRVAERTFSVFPQLWDLLNASRSTRAVLPGGDVIALKKFASMGSAVCFPVEALVFFITIISARIRSRALPVNTRTVKAMADGVYVYGDDIIVPVDEVPCVVRGLEAMGLRVNYRKSFWNGKFRESCGGEYYDGEWVTPIYLRKDLPDHRSATSRIISAVMTGRQLEKAGYWRTAELLYQSAEKFIGKLAQTSDDSGALGRYGISNHTPKGRWDNNLQCRVVKLPFVKARRQADPLNGYPALAKCFRIIGIDTIDPTHLQRSVRPRDLTISRNWVPSS